jgi:hypothetical protein
MHHRILVSGLVTVMCVVVLCGCGSVCGVMWVVGSSGEYRYGVAFTPYHLG